MTPVETAEHLKSCISRFDHYYDSVNNKSAAFLAISTFIVGGLVAVYPSMQSMFDCGAWINTVFATIIFVGIASMLLTLSAGIPFLGKPDNSIIYFRSIASKTLPEFSNLLMNVSPEEIVKDYADQAYQLSKGLTRKFRTLQIAGYCIFAQFVLAIPFIIMLIKNFKIK